MLDYLESIAMPVLYVIATPIGNLEDVSLRALRVLGEVALIAAEDTRKTRRLLHAYNIRKPVTSYHGHSHREKLDYLLDYLGRGDVALVSEAGMPGISDPGSELIREVIERGILVVPIPGPSAVITALAVSGLTAKRFLYLGFLPGRSGERRRLLGSVAQEEGLLVCFEAPHRLRAALKDIISVLGDRKMAVCRELTKIHEEIFRGQVSQAIAYFVEPRGEFTLVIEGEREKGKQPVSRDIEQRLDALRLEGATAKEAIALMAGEDGLSRRELYRTWLRLKKKG